MQFQLTDEQHAVTAHTYGPALVFAVAGAGKTTAMVHRIHQLVSHKVFAPQHILATSFGRLTVRNLQRELQRWPVCDPVHVLTLHGMAMHILTAAQARQCFILPDKVDDEEKGWSSHLFSLAAQRARKEGLVSYQDPLNHDDFLNYVSTCKSNLQYADYEALDLPASARHATQATAPEALPHYLPVYRLFEQERQKLNILTFDDMLTTAWELLHRYPALLQEMQQRWQCILVDEFQDVNLVQSELLDLLAAAHGNYMAIGDDDQTIYEWRGASPRFILDFAQRYQAQTYLLSDNFRCPLAPLALANQVIEHNRERYAKHLHLTQGLGGVTTLQRLGSDEQQAQAVRADIQNLLAEGYAPEDIAILIRNYAQTPFIEHALISAHIPYHIAGSKPFYRRQEVQGLLAYPRLALLEEKRRQGGLSAEEITQYGDLLTACMVSPRRYISKEFQEQILHKVLFEGHALTDTLRVISFSLKAGAAKEAVKLAQLLEGLSQGGLSQPARICLADLESQMDYCGYLLRESAVAEFGQNRADSVRAFIAYAEGKGAVVDLLQHLQTISFGTLDEADGDTSTGRILLCTVFRAKGLEWPVVMIPHCNRGLIPAHFSRNLEEERRIFYVALTRARKQLHLYALKDQPLSPFLEEAGAEQALQETRHLQHLMGQNPDEWQAADVHRLVSLTHKFHLERYFANWWDAPTDYVRQTAQQVLSLFAAARRRPELLAAGCAPQEATWQLFGVPQPQVVERFLAMPVDTGGALAPAEEADPVWRVGRRCQSVTYGPGEVIALSQHPLHGLKIQVHFDNGYTAAVLEKFGDLSPL